MNAYEVMSELGRLCAPLYRPSPGSIYPAMEALEAEGLIAAVDTGARTVYEPSPAGLAALDERKDALGTFELRTGVRVTRGRPIDAALERFTAEVRSVAAYLDPADLERLLVDAAALIRKHVPSRELQKNEEGANR